MSDASVAGNLQDVEFGAAAHAGTIASIRRPVEWAPKALFLVAVFTLAMVSFATQGIELLLAVQLALVAAAGIPNSLGQAFAFFNSDCALDSAVRLRWVFAVEAVIRNLK